MRAVRRQAADLGLLEVGAHGRAARQGHELPQRHPLLPRVAPRLLHHAGDPDEQAAGKRADGVHDHRVAVFERQRRDHEVPGRPPGLGILADLPARGVLLAWRDGERHVQRGPRQRARLALPGGENAVHGHALEQRVGAKTARGPHQVNERLSFLHLVDRGAEHRARELHPPPVQRHEHHVARLQADVVARIAAQQVVVEIERGHRLSEAPDVDLPHVGPPGDAPRSVQRREGRTEGADLIGPRLLHLSHDRDLVGAHARDRDVEADGSIGGAGQLGVDLAQPVVQDVAQPLERQVGHEHLSHLRDQDESLALHREGVGALHVAGDDEHQLVPGSEPVVGRDGAREDGQELGGGAPEHVHAEHVVAARQ